jgi:hypothetical protein
MQFTFKKKYVWGISGMKNKFESIESPQESRIHVMPLSPRADFYA